MAYLRIKENSKQGKLMLEYLKTMPYVDILEENDEIIKRISKNEFLSDFRKSIKEVKEKKTKSIRNLLDNE